MKMTFLILSILFAIMFSSCDDGSPTCFAGSRDSTSHNFNWTIQLLGDGGGSILYDVTIINDTLAYAVGEFYLRDSTGQLDLEPFGVAIWNGQSWRPKRVYPRYDGYQNPPPVRARGIFAFSATDIWLADGTVWRWDGASDTTFWRTGPFPSPDAGAQKLWGTSNSNLYAVGSQGVIARYNGSTWAKLESGTTLDIRDIWGGWNGRRWEVLAIASSSQTTEKALLRIEPNNTVAQLNTNGLSSFSTGIWFMPNCRYYVVGSGIHQKSSLGAPVWSVYAPGEVTSYASGGLRGNGLNDLFVVGSFFEIVHYNGSTWYNYRNEIPFTNGAFGGVAIKGNLVITVGPVGQQAVIAIGRR